MINFTKLGNNVARVQLVWASDVQHVQFDLTKRINVIQDMGTQPRIHWCLSIPPNWILP